MKQRKKVQPAEPMWEVKKQKIMGSIGQGTVRRHICYSDTLSTQHDLPHFASLSPHFPCSLLSGYKLSVCLSSILCKRALAPTNFIQQLLKGSMYKHLSQLLNTFTSVISMTNVQWTLEEGPTSVLCKQLQPGEFELPPAKLF